MTASMRPAASAASSFPDTDGFDRVNLTYLKNLGVNWLWFQPIHPQGIVGRQIDPDTGQPYEVGSPYAVRNFFQVSPLMGSDNTEADARLEFQNFVHESRTRAGINVMLDAPFNHTAHDVEVSDQGVPLFGGTAASLFRDTELRVLLPRRQLLRARRPPAPRRGGRARPAVEKIVKRLQAVGRAAAYVIDWRHGRACQSCRLRADLGRQRLAGEEVLRRLGTDDSRCE